MSVKYPDVHVQLTGENGNAFSIMGRVCSEMRRAKLPASELDAYTAEAMSGDYDHLLATTMRWVNVS